MPKKQRFLKRRTTNLEKSTIETMSAGDVRHPIGTIFNDGEVVVTHADGSMEIFQSETEYLAEYEEV